MPETVACKEFEIVRTFAAPRELVWRALTDANELAHWWGPAGFQWLRGSVDLRPGGVFHYGMKSPDGQTMWGKFVYREICPIEKLVFTSSFSDESGGTTRAPFSADFPLEVLNTITLEDRGAQTTLTQRGAAVNPTPAERSLFESMFLSMQQGFSSTYAQLDEHLKTMTAAK